jgi:hypothetical protein
VCDDLQTTEKHHKPPRDSVFVNRETTMKMLKMFRGPNVFTASKALFSREKRGFRVRTTSSQLIAGGGEVQIPRNNQRLDCAIPGKQIPGAALLDSGLA